MSDLVGQTVFKIYQLHLHHSTSADTRVKCPSCDKKFAGTLRKKNLMDHVNSEHAESWTCVFCGLVFQQSISRRRHQQTCAMNPFDSSVLLA